MQHADRSWPCRHGASTATRTSNDTGADVASLHRLEQMLMFDYAPAEPPSRRLAEVIQEIPAPLPVADTTAARALQVPALGCRRRPCKSQSPSTHYHPAMGLALALHSPASREERLGTLSLRVREADIRVSSWIDAEIRAKIASGKPVPRVLCHAGMSLSQSTL